MINKIFSFLGITLFYTALPICLIFLAAKALEDPVYKITPYIWKQVKCDDGINIQYKATSAGKKYRVLICLPKEINKSWKIENVFLSQEKNIINSSLLLQEIENSLPVFEYRSKTNIPDDISEKEKNILNNVDNFKYYYIYDLERNHYRLNSGYLNIMLLKYKDSDLSFEQAKQILEKEIIIEFYGIHTFKL
jgi:hypothetical protein